MMMTNICMENASNNHKWQTAGALKFHNIFFFFSVNGNRSVIPLAHKTTTSCFDLLCVSGET